MKNEGKNPCNRYIPTRELDVARRSLSLSAQIAAWLLAIAGADACAQGPAETVPSRPQEWTIEQAITWALTNNPDLAAQRQQYGIAAAEVVIARTYPYNPTLEVQIFGAGGPRDAGVTNQVPSQYLLTVPLEVRRQGQFRREAAAASLSRAEWEVVQRETALALQVAKAFRGVLYRERKLSLIEEAIRLNQESAEQVRKLVDAGKLRPGDLILTRTEIDDVRAQLTPGRAALAASRADLARGLGIISLQGKLRGEMMVAAMPLEKASLQATAQERRPDLRARQAAVAEAEAKLRLTQADRFGNPTIGPSYQFNESRVHFIGGQLSVPIPVLNARRGEIQQKDAERTRAVFELRETEVLIEQDVEAAWERLAHARDGVQLYESEILPHLRTGLSGIEKLFNQADPGVDVLKVIDMRRKLLRARDGYLDAQWEASQAQAELAGAVADPRLVAGASGNPAGAP
jgi:outer membrane protein, heavy metal efflux system